MSEKLDRRKQYTRKMLKESMIEMLKETSINHVTVKTLCEKADINRSTFYTHYRDPYDLLMTIEDEIISDLNDYLNSYRFDQDEESKLMTKKLLDYIEDTPETFRILLNENGDPAFEKRIMNVAHQFVMSNTYELDETVSDYYSTYIISGAIHVIKAWIASGRPEGTDDMANLIHAFANGELHL
ncbi:TetR/AcrR family transcriptional regulator [Alkalibacillus almallahensis]|uniref:TetR/AcrR family transcriptional regulator n=1 Tax=Alkalibacillus almallahensis TaxID=1379154 RepID=UPI0014234B5B|nr:TetR/AcrR family transcriptional regulator [Alkalibacillus almallahensis]NIK13422.1 AcrR family transcriptional regulator [Alkalibacillus almallahensis]